MLLKDKLHGLPYDKLEDGTHIVKAGKWYIEFNSDAYAIYAYSTYQNKDNFGHQIPASLVNGIPYYPFGIHSTMPVYAKQAIDLLVRKFGKE